MLLNKLDYKGKHYILQDASYGLAFLDHVIGTTTKADVLADKKFIYSHKELCKYYGIPCYIGQDRELREIFN